MPDDAVFLHFKSVEAKPGYKLAVHWDHGAHMIVDMTPIIEKGGVFDDLKDVKKFAKVRIGERNRIIEWPEPKDENGYPVIEIDAEALHSLGMKQRSSKAVGDLKKAASKLIEQVSSTLGAQKRKTD